MSYQEELKSAFDERDRFGFDEALAIVVQPSCWIKHLLDNQDGTYSTMGHITCDDCDYCDAEKAASDGWSLKPGMVHIAQMDARQEQKKRRK